MGEEEIILAEFKRAHQALLALNPEIIVSEILESSDKDWVESDKPVYQIDVKHPFVFDVRLIPDEFKGIPVKNIWVGEFPKEFPSSNESLPLEVWYAPERYERFVVENLSLLTEKLQIPNLTKMEALDALTGGFQKHKDWCNELRSNRENK